MGPTAPSPALCPPLQAKPRTSLRARSATPSADSGDAAETPVNPGSDDGSDHGSDRPALSMLAPSVHHLTDTLMAECPFSIATMIDSCRHTGIEFASGGSPNITDPKDATIW